ncbi:MAG: hypothetical protein AB7L13_16980 [Acidimicrobiia bacterium]
MTIGTVPGRGFAIDAPDVLEVSFRRAPLSERNHEPLLVTIGDDTVGPVIGLFYDGPSTPEELAGPPDLTPAHGHVCDNFRIVMKGELWVGRERYHHGDFRIQRSARPYGADGDAPHEEGNWRVISFADRRGFRTRFTNPELRAQGENDEAIARQREMTGWDILPPNDPGINGLATTLDKPWSKVQHIDASFAECDSWPVIGDDGRVCVNLMAHHEVGPIYIVQRTPAGAVATPGMTIGSDVFRCVIGGGYGEYAMGDCRFQASGVAWNEVVAGAGGLDELIVIGDRRGLASASDNAWIARIRELVAPLQAELDALDALAVRPGVDDVDRPELHAV